MSDIRIGISGWRYAPWRGIFYPKDLPQKQELAYASREFSTIELNGKRLVLRPANTRALCSLVRGYAARFPVQRQGASPAHAHAAAQSRAGAARQLPCLRPARTQGKARPHPVAVSAQHALRSGPICVLLRGLAARHESSPCAGPRLRRAARSPGTPSAWMAKPGEAPAATYSATLTMTSRCKPRAMPRR